MCSRVQRVQEVQRVQILKAKEAVGYFGVNGFGICEGGDFHHKC